MQGLPIPTFQPRLRVLNREQAMAIHTAALEILAKTGIKMEHETARSMLIDAGATRIGASRGIDIVRGAPGA